jgi:DNA-binding beta-propeller fold protein YncE
MGGRKAGRRRGAGRARGAILGAALSLALLLLGPASAQAAPPQLWQACPSGPPFGAAGRCEVPRGIAADPDTGHLFVADQSNARVNELSVWGEFVKSWGWGVGDGSAQLQTCGPEAAPPSASCQAGLEGSGAGQLSLPQGIALDSEGDVYVVDRNNLRVQKFSPAGEFLLTFGGEVNKTKVGERKEQEANAEPVTVTEAEENLCTAGSGDECGKGSEGTGNGQFEGWAFGSYLAIDPLGTPSAADDKVYVGEEERIQRFDTGGAYQAQIPLPEAGTVRFLAVDPLSGDLYFAYASATVNFPIQEALQPDVYRLNETTGAVLDVLEMRIPQAIATDDEGNVYVFDAKSFNGNGGQDVPPNHPSRVLVFDSSGNEIAKLFEAEISESNGLATNPVTEAGELEIYVVDFGNSALGHLRAFGPPPDKWLPPKAPPSIDSSYATSVTTDSAVIRAQINPHFWSTTRYYVQYGTGKCSEGGCIEQPAPPGSLLTSNQVNEDVTTSAIFLTGLQPDTTYHYRFIAKTTFGPGEEAEVQGEESSFHTVPPPASSNTNCPNQALRSGLSARLPDCRAYEMVSPPEKEGDIRGEMFGIGQARADGGKLTYSAEFAPFAEPDSAPIVSQYLAERDASGWASRSIVPPTAAPYLVFPPQGSLFDAFSPDLCRGWFLQESDLVLAPGAPPHYPSLYESDLCGEGGYRPISPVTPPKHEPGVKGTGLGNTYLTGTQGFSGGGEVVVFYANSKLTADASDAELLSASGGPIFQLYGTDEAGEVHLISVLPDGSATDESSSLGAFTATNFGIPKDGTFRHAVSDDGSRVFWTCCGGSASLPGSGRIYLRLNPTQPQSAQALGSAAGSGNLSAGSDKVTLLKAAEGKADFSAGSATAILLETSLGRFLPGQPVNAPAAELPPGTTITEVSGSTLTLSAPAGKSGAAKTISSKGPLPFAVGQTITAPGIPLKTTIIAVAEGSLTLSADATQTQAAAKLSAYSECTEADKACTIPVSEAVSGGEALFKAASPDGKRAIFSLGTSLYEYDADAALADEAAVSPIADGYVGFMGASEDASRVYFASNQDLGAGPNPEGDLPVAGKANLYLHERGGELAFIGTFSAEDLKFIDETGEPTPLGLRLGSHGSRVSPDGLHAAFHTSSSLSDYDNAEATNGHVTVQVYLYDAPSGGEEAQLHCASCNPSGGRPKAVVIEANKPVEYWAAALLPGWETEQQPSRLLADDGRRLFFESYDALLPRDANGVKDVYQWEAAGKGDCDLEAAHYFDQNKGCISLISSGASAKESRFIDASADGSDVFFETQSSLVSQDPGLVDVYDARINGGFPEPPQRPGACEGEACQSSPEAPNDPTPASSAFQGTGNVVEGAPRPKPCAKGKVRKHGKCVKKRKQKRHKRAAAKRRAKR